MIQLIKDYMRFLVIVIIGLVIGSCNLRPIYSEKHYSKVTNDLEAIDVEPIGSIEGAEFYHRLTSILPQTMPAKYLLKAQFAAGIIPATIEKNSNVLRESINQTVNYQLIDLTTNKVLISEKFHQNTSYNAIFAVYAANVERDKTAIDLAYRAAEEIRSRLILYFAHKDIQG